MTASLQQLPVRCFGSFGCCRCFRGSPQAQLLRQQRRPWVLAQSCQATRQAGRALPGDCRRHSVGTEKTDAGVDLHSRRETAEHLSPPSSCRVAADDSVAQHLNPPPDDYSRFIFQDRCRKTIYAGSGGHGCVSFLREKYIEEGPPNGGDGGSGGSVYIQAVQGLASLHKLARQGVIRAGRGKNGQGKSKGGKRGHDVLIQVPVGTVVREVDRYDPVAEEEARIREEARARREAAAAAAAAASSSDSDSDYGGIEEQQAPPIRRDRWVLYPGAKASDFLMTKFPKLAPRRPHLAAMEPKQPIHLDLSRHMDKPMLLAAGAMGGFGNPHFATRAAGRPKFASRGEGGLRLELDFELKLLADVGLVGKPNAGKSTLLRSLTSSRTRVGNWEFTTLSPNIGTVVLDNHTGRPLVESRQKSEDAAILRRTNFTIADIPGLVEGAHLDRGLGLGFLRHIERARMLAFVVDLSRGDPVQGLRVLWHELGEYARMRSVDEQHGPVYALPEWQQQQQQQQQRISWASQMLRASGSPLAPLTLPPIHSKPWVVIATKADLDGTRDSFRALRDYLSDVETGLVEHPGGRPDAWKQKLSAIPVSAIRGEGVGRIPKIVVELLDEA